MFYQRKMGFFVHYCVDSNYHPEDWPQHRRLFLVLMHSDSVVILLEVVNLLPCGFLCWTPKLSTEFKKIW